MGRALWLVDASGIVVVEMQLWVTSKTMQVEWATHCVQNLIKNGNLAKITTWIKTIGIVCNGILMKSCHPRTKGIGQEECVVSPVNAVLLHSYVVAIGSSLHWMAHLQCRMLIMQSAVVKM